MAMPSSIENQQQEVSGEDDNETYSFASQLVLGTCLPMAWQTACELGILEIIAKAGPGAKLSATDKSARSKCEDDNETYSFASQLVLGTCLPMAWQTACELGILEIIAKAGPGAKLSATDIAAQLPTKNQGAPIMVDRIVKLLASHNVMCCSVVGLEGHYSLSPVSLTKMLYQLKYAVLGGGIAFNRVHGAHAFDYPGLDARFNQVFNTAMLNLSTMFTKKLFHSYDGFHGIKQLVDVGDNFGITLHYITSKYPNINGINFDLPQVIQHAPSYPGIEHVAGNMFENVPQGDAIFLKLVLHDWSDEKCLRLLKNCYKAISNNGKVIVVDSVVLVMAKSTPSAKATFLLDMLMMT
ncbi:Anthranilate N-methyltransferase [Gossypium australe]|uniref:Anthranilate N-methyltransferase n=1 Tax=Gossypium australe TaxID=47621 RepID=A0A5B6UWZ9_9ROSI|nr:Anthranilate N-methyltransferase [Gossypium australe]